MQSQNFFRETYDSFRHFRSSNMKKTDASVSCASVFHIWLCSFRLLYPISGKKNRGKITFSQVLLKGLICPGISTISGLCFRLISSRSSVHTPLCACGLSILIPLHENAQTIFSLPLRPTILYSSYILRPASDKADLFLPAFRNLLLQSEAYQTVCR